MTTYSQLDKVLQRVLCSHILERAMQPGGVDMWAAVDRKIPGETFGWVIVPQTIDYSPGTRRLTDETVTNAIRILQSSATLDQLNITEQFLDQVDQLLGHQAASPYDFEPVMCAKIVQIGLFGQVIYE